jgi:predicted acylesterase/phospholipase RssA
MMRPARLVFSGGGTRCLVFLQALVEFDSAGLLTDVKVYWGTSAGAFLAALMTITRSPARVKELMFQTDYTKFRNVDISNILSITNTWGLDDGRSLVEEIERVLESVEVGASGRKLADTKGLNIIVSDLHSRETIVCNSDTYPEIRVVDAIRASMSLPILYTPYKHTNGHLWVDGAVKANFPWHLLPDDEARTSALGFAFEKPWLQGPKNFTEYVFSMIHFDDPKKTEYLKTNWKHNILWFPSPPFPSWFVRFKEEDYLLVTSIGDDIAKKAMTKWSTRDFPVRTNEILPPSEHRNILEPTRPGDRIVESSGSPKSSSPLLPRDSSLPQSRSIIPSSRRWSV